MEILNDVLTEVGLDRKEAQVYTTLINNGPLTVAQLAYKSKQKRTNLYNILSNLESLSLVKKETTGSTTKYSPNSPEEIEKLIKRKKAMLGHARLNFEIIKDSLISNYTLIENKPLISTYEGLEGLQKIYEDINYTGDALLLFRSQFENQTEELGDVIDDQMIKQVKLGIKTKVMGPPYEDKKAMEKIFTEYDKYRLVEQRFVTSVDFVLPAQIMIYGNKISISTIKKEIITTLIDNKDITDTFRIIFNAIWDYSEKEHKELISKWKK
jgi:sugar-specific transcriptional regulator TrmB